MASSVDLPGASKTHDIYKASDKSDGHEVPQGGYSDVVFVESPPDSLTCPICLSALKQPHLLSCCGSHLCEVKMHYTISHVQLLLFL